MTIDNENQNSEQKGERIAKALARAGVASRREVERMIEAGRIYVRGKKLETAAFLVTSLKGITVDGVHIADQVSHTRLWRFNKPRGVLTTHHDPQGRPTVFDRLPEHMGRVISVGRLDMNTEGLLLLTNDGELARYLELPTTALTRRYRVRVHGRVNEKALIKLKDGVTIDGTHYGEIEAELERQTGANAWLTVAIKEGKNREVRRIMEHLGLEVNRLIRTHYGPFTLTNIPLGGATVVGEKQMYDALGDYFKDAPQSVAAPEKKRDPSKWAKAKPKTKVELGASRRRKAIAARKNEEPCTNKKGKTTKAEVKSAGSRSTSQRPTRKNPAEKRPTEKKPAGKNSTTKTLTSKKPTQKSKPQTRSKPKS